MYLQSIQVLVLMNLFCLYSNVDQTPRLKSLKMNSKQESVTASRKKSANQMTKLAERWQITSSTLIPQNKRNKHVEDITSIQKSRRSQVFSKFKQRLFNMDEEASLKEMNPFQMVKQSVTSQPLEIADDTPTTPSQLDTFHVSFNLLEKPHVTSNYLGILPVTPNVLETISETPKQMDTFHASSTLLVPPSETSEEPDTLGMTSQQFDRPISTSKLLESQAGHPKISTTSSTHQNLKQKPFDGSALKDKFFKPPNPEETPDTSPWSAKPINSTSAKEFSSSEQDCTKNKTIDLNKIANITTKVPAARVLVQLYKTLDEKPGFKVTKEARILSKLQQRQASKLGTTKTPAFLTTHTSAKNILGTHSKPESQIKTESFTEPAISDHSISDKMTATSTSSISELDSLSGIKSWTKYGDCKILTHDGSTTLLCSHLNLTYIPKTSMKLDNIIFEYNDIENVTTETFTNISQPEYLKGIDLNYDNIHSISSNALERFVNLAYLHISGNPFHYYNLKNFLSAISKMRSLRFLEMSAIHTITTTDDLFSHMKGSKINFLILKQYQLGSFSMKVLKNFAYLRSLVLAGNNITDIVLYRFPHLEKLYLTMNRLRTIPNFCETTGDQSLPYFQKLYFLSLSNNQITDVSKASFECLENLKFLQLQINFLSIIPNDFLENMPKLQALDIRNQNGRFNKIQPYAFRSNSLKDIRMGYNAEALSLFSSLNDTFKSAPNLRVLKIDYISMLHLSIEDFGQLFGPLTKLLYLRCFSCKITIDPKHILANKPELNNLDLGSNLVQTISKETFGHNKKLKKLKMRFNKIGHLQESALPKELLNNLVEFDLSKNPLTCDCNLLWFIDWLKASSGKNKTLNYPKDYICSNPADKANMKLSEVKFSYRECHPWSIGIWIAVVACPCIVVIAIISLVIYRNRWNIKHYIYLLRKRRNYQLIRGNDYEYDAFVSYEANDSPWVRRSLLPVLEDTEELKLCIHERDFLPGIFINDNIVKCMEKSKKIIIILTNVFAQSDWCIFELKVAQSRLIEEGTDVVVILLEKIDAHNMNHTIKLLLETTTYIEWTEDLVGRELFWNNLKDVFKK